MLDFGHLPTNTGATDIQTFTSPGIFTWNKPRGKTMLSILAVGGGSGGGAGFTRIAGTAGGGGGSGASNSQSRMLIPLYSLPDTLVVIVGQGGRGAIFGGVSSGNGTASIVQLPTSNLGAAFVSTNCIINTNGTISISSGGNGSATAAGAGGTIPSANSLINFLLGYSLSTSLQIVQGQAGVAGGSHTGAVGTASAVSTVTGRWGGSGGAGTTSADFAGGLFTPITGSYISTFRPGTASTVAGSNHGEDGLTAPNYLYAFGGGGGSSSNTGVGGNGGKGGMGCGGGGGGAGTTGGNGGAGGDGFVLMIAW